MIDFAAEYQQLNDDELLQLWTERSQLIPNAQSVLNDEICRRGLSKEAVEKSTPVEAFPKPLAPPVETYINLSVLFWWLRELWLRSRTKHGVSVQARVESTRMTERAYRSAARAELRYSYEFQGHDYSGRAVRDFMFGGTSAADSLAFDHKSGEIISVQVNPEHPEYSYFPSDFGWIDPIITGLFSLLIWAVLLAMVVGIILERLRK